MIQTLEFAVVLPIMAANTAILLILSSFYSSVYSACHIRALWWLKEKYFWEGLGVVFHLLQSMEKPRVFTGTVPRLELKATFKHTNNEIDDDDDEDAFL